MEEVPSDLDGSAGLLNSASAEITAPSTSVVAAASVSVSDPSPPTNPMEMKKTGRPVHPLWAHFHRGEKRNRYHYHAFCIYCVARYGAAAVAPTRGVSNDMLRHLEKCTNCPRKVVESIKDICGRRDAVRFDRYILKKKSGDNGEEEPHRQSHQGVHHSSTAEENVHGEHHVAAESEVGQHEFIQGQHIHERHDHGIRMPSGVIGMTTHGSFDEGSSAGGGRSGHPQNGTPAHGGIRLASTMESHHSSAKRLRSSSAIHSPSLNGDANAWKIQLLKAAVTAGLPFHAFENAEFRTLIRYISPSSVRDNTGSITDHHFLTETASRLAHEQLDRVKEGMLNSTIKGGLTLSINSWSTLDLQELVSFTLVNSNGDAACVSVIDMGNHASFYTSTQLALKIEDLLLKLEEQSISVMGIVADSVVALNAAQRVVALNTRRRSLLIVPCLSKVLSTLAGSLLTHDVFSDTIGHMIEIASYFTNEHILRALRAESGDQDARIPLPNRENWFSFVECIVQMSKYGSFISSMCSREELSDEQGVVIRVPRQLKALITDEGGHIWKSLEELIVLLWPLRETYSVLFQQKVKMNDVDEHNKSNHTEGDGVAAAHGLSLALVMYQWARMSQQYAALRGSSNDDLVNMMHDRIGLIWKRYDLPVMVLAYVFDFHLDTALLNMNNTWLQWDSIATYFQVYFQKWFDPKLKAYQNGERESDNATISGVPNTVVPIPDSRITEMFSAYKLKQFPFDPDTTSDYVDVSSFYSFVSDSHPEICALCCRMYAISLLSANVHQIIRGIGFVPSIAQSTKGQEMVELLLHVGFASSLKKISPPQRVDNSSPTSARMDNSNKDDVLLRLNRMMQGYHVDQLFWAQDVWNDFASEWKNYVEQELDMTEFNEISVSSNNSDGVHMQVNLPLEEIFTGTLPPLPAAVEAGLDATNDEVFHGNVMLMKC